MLITAKPPSQRNATTTVEMAAVISVLILLLFGIFEYCMVVYTYDIVGNAAREGARYAVVNVTPATMVSDTQDYVKSLMAGLDTKMTGYSCTVYLADANGNNIESGSVNATTAQFGQYICVDVSVTYVPMTPGLSYVKTFTIRSKSSMISEAN